MGVYLCVCMETLCKQYLDGPEEGAAAYGSGMQAVRATVYVLGIESLSSVKQTRLCKR